jgi:hypothetical protein
MLCTITVMNIPIYNSYSIKLMMLKKISGTYCNIIINTKSIDCMPSPRMMSRRPHTCESVLPLSIHYSINAIKNSSYRKLSTHLTFFIKISIKYSYISTMRSFGPKSAHMFYISFRVNKTYNLVINYALDTIDILNMWMSCIKFLL